MYTCREIERLLDTYTDGELDEPRRLRVEAHLQGCALCRRLVRCKEDEARLIRSGDPVPPISASFTRQVMSNLAHRDSRAWGEEFFPLRKVVTRPWLAPALAGLMLLVTVSWAASRHLLPVIPGQVALQNSLVNSTAPKGHPGQAAPPDSTGNNSPVLQGNQVFGPEQPAPKEARGVTGSEAPSASGGPAKQENSRAIAPSPQPQAPGSGVAFKTMTPQGPAPQPISYAELEQQGYTVFQPSNLPAGYSLSSCSLQPPGPATDSGSSAGTAGNTQVVTPSPGKDSLLFTYRNTQTGGWITLEIQPLNSTAPAAAGPASSTKATYAFPAVLPSSAGPALSKTTVNQFAASSASATTTGNQPPGTDQITWDAQKNGAGFTLTVTGSLPDEELKKVAASVQ